MPVLLLNAKRVFVVWYFVLGELYTWLFFEYFYPHHWYWSPELSLLVVLFFSTLLLAITLRRLHEYFKRTTSPQKTTLLITVMFVVATIILAGIMAQNAYISAENKSKVQWYITDLESKGLSVSYLPYYCDENPYSRVVTADSYSEFINFAKTKASSPHVSVAGGVPSFFQFFVPAKIELITSHGMGPFIFVD